MIRMGKIQNTFTISSHNTARLPLQWKSVFCMLLISLVVSKPLLARDQDLFSMSLEDLLQVEVSIASSSPEATLTAPATITLFTRQKLDRLGINTLTDLYRFIPGFTSQFNSVEDNQSYLVSRGHAQKFGSSILYLYNGQRLNDDYSGGISYFIRHFDLSNVERIEVIRGPGSATYGANAFHGVINIITNTHNHLNINTGTTLSLNASLGLTHSIGELDVGINISQNDDGGDYFESLYDPFDRQTSTTDPHKETQIETVVSYHELTWRFLFQSHERENYYLDRRLSDGINHLKTDNQIHQIEYTPYQTNQYGVSFSAQLARGDRDSIGTRVARDSDTFVEDDWNFGINIEHKSLSFKTSGYYKLSDTSRFSGGASYVRSQIPSAFFKSNYDVFNGFGYLGVTQEFDESSLKAVGDSTREITSVFAQYNWQVNDLLNITIGGRHDHYNDISSELTPRLAAVYSLDRHHVFKLLYNEAYRVPSIGDLYDDGNVLSPGNINVKPMMLRATELAYNYVDDDSFHSFTLFNNDIENIIGITGIDNLKVENLGHNKSRGLEVESQFNVTPDVSVLLSYTQLFSNNTDAFELSTATETEYLSPKRYADAAIDINLTTNISFNFQIQWRDGIAVLTDTSSLVLFDGLMDYQLSEASRIRIQLHNIANTHYFHSQDIQLGTVNGDIIQQVPARGREIQVGWRYSF